MGFCMTGLRFGLEKKNKTEIFARRAMVDQLPAHHPFISLTCYFKPADMLSTAITQTIKLSVVDLYEANSICMKLTRFEISQ